MNCTDFEDRLHAQFAAARFDETPDLTDHAGQCSACRLELEQFRLLADSLRVWRDQVPDVDLTDAVVAACRLESESSSLARHTGPMVMPRRDSIESTPRSPSASPAGIVARRFPFPAWFNSRRRTLWLAVGSLVGVLVFAVVLSGLIKKVPLNDAGPQVAKTPAPAELHSTPNAAERIQPVNPTASPPPTVPEAAARDAYYDLAQKAAGALGEVTVYVMPGSSARPMSPADERPEKTGGWIEGVKHQLQPIGRSLDDTFDFLWEAGQSADSSKT